MTAPRALGTAMQDECARIAAIEAEITAGLMQMIPHRRRLWAATEIAIRTPDPARAPALMPALADIVTECDRLRTLALHVAAEAARLSGRSPTIRPAGPTPGTPRARLNELYPAHRRP